MSHSVIMALEESKSTYVGYTWVLPLNHPQQGLGQGNGANPVIWDTVSTTLINCLRKSGHVTAFKWSISGDTTNLVGYCFIDDFKIFQIFPTPTNPQKSQSSLLNKASTYLQGKQKQRENKSVFRKKWYLLEFAWDPSGKQTLENNNTHLSLENQEGDQQI